MKVNIGSKGLVEVDLTLPQGTTLDFTIFHLDESGEPVDHTESTFASAIQTTAGTTAADISEYCTGTVGGIEVALPASVSSSLQANKAYRWDLIATLTSGDVVRLAYGKVTVVDTYALDE